MLRRKAQTLITIREMLIVKTELRILIYNLLITFLAADGGWPSAVNFTLVCSLILILTECYSFKKHIPVKNTKKYGMTILKEHYSFFMEQQALVELL